MKSIDVAAREYAIHMARSDSYEQNDLEAAFKAGVEFAQRWIPVEEELPPLNTLLQVKGIIEGGKIGYDFAKFEFKKGLCAYHLIRATHWRPIELK